jgi:mono/diheme cytochrome c family protein
MARKPTPEHRHRTLFRAAVVGALAAGTMAAVWTPPASWPDRLQDTGLYAPGGTIAAGLLEFSPQYPLWTDGASKRRWISLPAGSTIDASDPDAWKFPPGTRVWKEFASGRPVETRVIERGADGRWRFATYIWNEAGTEARLAPPEGATLENIAGMPGGRYRVPSREDCVACHEAAPARVLGFGALQLSADRDPLAPHATPAPAGSLLPDLAARGWLSGLPAELLTTPPRIDGRTPEERAALGWLHGNCGHCHNDRGPLASLGLVLARPGSGARPQEPLPVARMLERLRSTNPFTRMPPAGVQVADHEAIELVARGLAAHHPTTQETRP